MKAITITACCATLAIICLDVTLTAADGNEKAQVVDARRLMNEFAAEEEDASKKYGKKLLEIEGLVVGKTDPRQGKPLILQLVEPRRLSTCLGCPGECKCGCPASLVASGNYAVQDVINLLIEIGKVEPLTGAEANLLKQLSPNDYDAYVKEPPLVIVCQFEPRSADYEKASRLSERQKVKVRGRYNKAKTGAEDATSVPGLLECALAETGPDPALTAEQLTKDFATDPKTAATKYKRKALIVAGTVARIEKEPSTVHLEGHDPKAEKPFRVRITAFDKKALAQLKEGSKVKVRAQCPTGRADAVDLRYLWLSW
jgi:hypothetical protein